MIWRGCIFANEKRNITKKDRTLKIEMKNFLKNIFTRKLFSAF